MKPINQKNPITHISKVQIQGLWDKYNFEWNLNPDVNILAGANGSGKSTILDFMGAPFTELEIRNKNLSKIKQIIITFNQNETYQISNNAKSKIGTLHSPNVAVINTFDYPIASILNTLNTYPKHIDVEFDSALDTELYDLQKGYLDYQLNIGKRKNAIIENEASENIKEKIAIIQAPQARFLEMIDELFSETNKKVDRDKNEVSFLLANEKEIKINQLSSGEKQVLLILLTALLQDHKPTIFFLDEPEISLHVEWQKKLIDFIRELNPNAQIIIATHSPAMIMNGWRKHVFNMHNLLTPIA